MCVPRCRGVVCIANTGTGLRPQERSPLAQMGRAGLPQVWRYLVSLEGRRRPICVLNPGSRHSRVGGGSGYGPGFERQPSMGRCRIKERRILKGLVGDLYCAIPRPAPDQPGEIYCGNIRRPSPLLRSGHCLSTRLPCPGRVQPLKGPRGPRGRGSETPGGREPASRTSESDRASCCGIRLISGNAS